MSNAAGAPTRPGQRTLPAELQHPEPELHVGIELQAVDADRRPAREGTQHGRRQPRDAARDQAHRAVGDVRKPGHARLVAAPGPND
jgi:hypothetical protein